MDCHSIGSFLGSLLRLEMLREQEREEKVSMMMESLRTSSIRFVGVLLLSCEVAESAGARELTTFICVSYFRNFTQRLKFNRRGLVAMANLGRRNTNLSQFFFTLDVTTELQNKNTIFGRVAAGDTLFNVLKLGEVELEPGTDRPVFPPKIKSVEVKDNPFEDIVPRITAKERKEQEKAKREMKIERAKQREQGKRKGTK